MTSSSTSALPLLLLQTLDSQRQSGQFCDVQLKFGAQASFAHGCVLTAASGYFAKLLRRMEAEGKSRMLQLEVEELFTGMELSLEDALSFLYLGRSQTLSRTVMDALANRLELKCEASSAVAQLREEIVSAEEKRRELNIKMDVSFCHKCDLLFISKEEFLTHRMLNCTRKFTCQTCGTMFSRVQALLEHLVEVRHGETVCSVCSLTCLSSTEMEAHVRKHLGQKPYFCLQCDSRFNSRYALAHHVPKHSAETPFVCQVCTKGFKWKHALTSHMITHSSDKKFLCQDCGFATSHSSVFKNHQRIHSGQTMKCGLPGCTFETVRKQNLVQHQMTHSKEKPHQCEFCGKAFSLVKNMRRHMRQHDFTAMKHACHVEGCNFGTLRGDKFVEHMRRHNEDLGCVQQGQQNRQNGSGLRSLFDTINPPNKTAADADESTYRLESGQCDVKHETGDLIFPTMAVPIIS